MMIELDPRESIALIESLARDIENQKSESNFYNTSLLLNVSLKVKSQILEHLASRQTPASKTQVDRYIDSQLQKIQEMQQKSSQNQLE